MGSFLEYIWALADHWGALMTGGIFIALLAVYERAREQAISWRVYLWIVVLFFFTASFLAWKDEKSARVHAECRLGNEHNVGGQRHQFVVGQLQGFYAKVQELMHRSITPEQFSIWANDERRLAHDMREWVRSNLGDPAAARLQDMNGPSYDFAGMPSINVQYVGSLNWLNKVSANLVTLQQPEWDGHKIASELKCP